MGNNMEPQPHNPKKYDPNKNFFKWGAISLGLLAILDNWRETVAKMKSGYQRANTEIDKQLEVLYGQIQDAEMGTEAYERLIEDKKLLERVRAEQEQIIEELEQTDNVLADMQRYRQVQQDNTRRKSEAQTLLYLQILRQLERERKRDLYHK
jgi:hypothetical protein